MSRFSFFRWGKSKSDTDDASGNNDRFVADRIDRKKDSAQNGVDDPHLPEKKRARRCLVGSIALVLAAIVILPMVFESKPKQSAPNLVIDIPSKDKPLQTAGIAQPSPTSAAPGEEAAMQQTDEETVSETTPARIADGTAEGVQQAGTAVVTPESGGTVVSAGTTEKTAAVAQGIDSGQSQAVVDKQTQADKEKQQQAEKARQEKAKVEADDPIGKMIADKNAAAAGAGKQMIQVAALGSQQKANELQARLSKAGIRSHTQKVKTKNGEERIRVRIGPLSGKREVDSTCSKLKSMGLSCTLVSN